MTLLRAFGRFWYDFIVGDDWKIPVAVVLAVALTVAMEKTHLLGDSWVTVVGGVTIVAAFVITLAVDVRNGE